MKNLLGYANMYIERCELKDFALLKICLCSVGIMIGLSIPEKKKKCPLMAAGFIFIFSYILLMAGFFKIIIEERQGRYID